MGHDYFEHVPNPTQIDIKKMIPFNIAAQTGREIKYIQQAISSGKLSANAPFCRKCESQLEDMLQVGKVLLSPSGSAALDMSAILADIKPGDEVIMPSFTYPSTANAFALRGAKIIFTDIRPDTMNINEELVEAAISKHTKAIVPVHYAGVVCEMDKILFLARKKNMLVIEDAAMSIGSLYKGRAAGSIGDMACLSFHETKNISCGEGGAICINNEKYVKRAQITREKGTNRIEFEKGEVDKYTWVDLGSSFLLSELNAAYLYAQLEAYQQIISKRKKLWKYYFNGLKGIADEGKIIIPNIPEHCSHNAHMFYIKTQESKQREKLLKYLNNKGILAIFHYIPLHTAKGGKAFGVFRGKDIFTSTESSKLLRLPLYYGLKTSEVNYIVDCIIDFYKS